MSDEDEDEDRDDDDGDGDDDGGDEEGGGGGLSPLKIGLFAGIPVVLIIGGVIAAYFLGVFGGSGDEEEVAADEGPAIMTDPVAFVDIPPLTVNLATTGNQPAMLQLTLSLELSDPALKPEVEAVLPRVIDGFLVFLRQLRVEDIAGSRGTYRIKEELLTRVNTAAAPSRVEDVLFREMLVQ